MFESISFQLISVKTLDNSFILETDKGIVYVAHHGHLQTELINQADFVISCFYKGEKSPFSESFRGRPVSTVTKDGVLTATCTTLTLSISNESEIDSKIDKLKELRSGMEVPKVAYRVIKSLELSQKLKYVLYLSLQLALENRDKYGFDMNLQFKYFGDLNFNSYEELMQYRQLQEYILQFV